jgi:hypothetical protein
MMTTNIYKSFNERSGQLVALSLCLLLLLSPAARSEEITGQCLRDLGERLNPLPASIIFIEVGEITATDDSCDPEEIRRAITDQLSSSLRFKLRQGDRVDAILTGKARSLLPGFHDQPGLAILLDLRRVPDGTLLWNSSFTCRKFRRLRLSLNAGTTLSKAKFCRVQFNVFEKQGGNYQEFSSFGSSTEIWPPSGSLRLELRSHSRILSALVLQAGLARLNLGGVDGNGGGETPTFLTNGSEVRPIDCQLAGSWVTTIAGQWQLSPGRLVGTGTDPFFISLGAGALHYRITYNLSLPASYLPAGSPGPLSERVTITGFLPGYFVLASLDIPVSDHLRLFYDHTQYEATTNVLSRGGPNGAELFGYQLTVAKNRLYTIGLRIIY